MHTRSSIYVLTQSNPANSSFIFSWKISGLLHRPIGSFWYSYLPHGSTIVHSFLEFGHSSIWQYPIFKSSDEAYLKPSNFSSKSCILGIGNGFLQILLFNSLKSDINLTVPFFLDIINVGAAHSLILIFLSTPISTNRSSSFFRVASCTFGIGKGLA